MHYPTLQKCKWKDSQLSYTYSVEANFDKYGGVYGFDTIEIYSQLLFVSNVEIISFVLKHSNMKSKFTFTLMLLLGVAFTAASQTTDAEAEAIINLLGVQKKQAIAQLVPVSGKDSVAFWELYNEYDKETKSFALSRLSLYENTAASYNNMTPAVADSLALKYFSNRFEQEKTMETYYKKIKAATNAVIAFEFYQAEVYMLTQLRAQIMQQIPTYGQLKLASGKKN